MRRTVRLFTLFGLVLVAGALNLSAAKGHDDNLIQETCTPCKRSVCVQQCGSQQPAFCEFDPVTGCFYCACNG